MHTNPCPACLHHYEARPRAHYIADGCQSCGAKATHHAYVVGPSCPTGEPMGDGYDYCATCAAQVMAMADPFKHCCDACIACHSEGGCNCSPEAVGAARDALWGAA